MTGRGNATPDVEAVVAALRSAGCVFAEEEAELLVAAAGSPAELADLIARRVAGLPLEHLLGWAEFCGLRIGVDPGVFVPRRRTELMVEAVIDVATAPPRVTRIQCPPARTIVVVDLCCGCGALGVALAHRLASVELHAADLDPAAVRCARRNVGPIGGQVWQGDLYDALPVDLAGRVDVLVANAPYVPTGAIELMPAEARLHEPLVALDGGADGLDILRRLVAEGPRWLTPGGSLFVETSRRQLPDTLEAVRRSGLTAHVTESEDLGATVVIGTATTAAGPRRR